MHSITFVTRFDPPEPFAGDQLYLGMFQNANAFFEQTVEEQEFVGDELTLGAVHQNTNTFFAVELVEPIVDSLTLGATFENANTYYSQALGVIDNLVVNIHYNTNTFYEQEFVEPEYDELTLGAVFENTNTTYEQIFVERYTLLEPNIFLNTNTFFETSLTGIDVLEAALYENANTFYSQEFATSGVTDELEPALFENTETTFDQTFEEEAPDDAYLPHRYWRLYVDENNGDSTTLIAQLQLFVDYDNRDAKTLNYYSTVTVSSGSGGGNLDDAQGLNYFGASGWTSSTGADEWAQYDFNNPFNEGSFPAEDAVAVVGFGIFIPRGADCPAQAPKDMRLQYSDDASTWTDHTVALGQDDWREYGGEYRAFYREEPPVVAGESRFGAHEYWRVHVTHNTADTYNVLVAELEFYDENGDLVSTGGTPYANVDSGEAIYAFDSDDDTAWGLVAGGISTATIGYEFASPVQISKIRMQMPSGSENHACDGGYLQYSDNGSQWHTAWAFQTDENTPSEYFDAADPEFVEAPSGPMPYWRFTFDEANYIKVFRAELLDEFGGTINVLPLADDITSANPDGTPTHVASYLDDEWYDSGNVATPRWWIEFCNPPTSFTVDFSTSPQEIKGIAVWNDPNDSYTPVGVTIAYSPDDVTYYDVGHTSFDATKDAGARQTAWISEGAPDEIEIIDPGVRDKWRLQTVSTQYLNSLVSIAELEFLDSAGATLNVGGTINVSSNSTDKANMLDADTGTRWTSDGNTWGEWVEYEFASPVRVDGMRLTSPGGGFFGLAPVRGAIQYYDDATSRWHTYWDYDVGSLGGADTFTVSCPGVVIPPTPVPGPDTGENVWNVADRSPLLSISGGGTSAFIGTGIATKYRGVRAVNPIIGKTVWAVRRENNAVAAMNNNDVSVGIATLSENINSAALGSQGAIVKGNGNLWWSTGLRDTAYVADLADDDAVIYVAFDPTTLQVWFGDGTASGGTVTWQGDPAAGTGEAHTVAAGDYYPYVQFRRASQGIVASFDGTDPDFTPAAAPSGFAYFDAI